MNSNLRTSVLLRKFIVLGFFTFIIQNSFAQNNQAKWTLQQCIQHALDNNIQIKESSLNLEESEIDRSDALGNYLPDVNLSASNNWNSGLTQDVTTGILEQQTTRNLSLNATAGIPLFQGLQNLKQWQRAKLTKLANEYSLEEMKDNVLLNVTNAYLNVLVNKERLEVIKEQNELTREELQRARTLIEAGAAPAGDSLDIRATYAQEKQQIVTAENNIRITLINLAQLLQIRDYKNFDIVEAEYDVPVETILVRTPEEIIQRAKETRHEIKVAEQELEIAEKDVEIAKSQFYPTLNGFLNFNTRESGARRAFQGGIDPDNPTQVIGELEGTGERVLAPNYILEEAGPEPFFRQLSRNKGWSYGIQLNIPVFNGFSTRNSVKRSEINVKRNQYELEQAELDLESNVYQAYIDAQGAAEAYRAAQVVTVSKQQAFAYSQTQFDVGRISSFEFNQAKFELSNAESELVNAKFDYIFKLKVLELYFGIAPEDINI